MKLLLKNVYTALIAFSIAALPISCDDFLDEKPTAELASSQIFSSKSNLEALRAGMYGRLLGNDKNDGKPWEHEFLYFDLIPRFGNILGGDFINYFGSFRNEYLFKASIASRKIWAMWVEVYGVLEVINSIEANKDQIIKTLGNKSGNNFVAEAIALRAMVMTDFARFHGKAYHLDNGASKAVPYINKLQKVSDLPERNTMKEINDLAIKDLLNAIKHLKPAKGNEMYMNKNATYAILSRIYLDQHQWSKAEEAAKNALSGITLLDNKTYSKGISRKNAESILCFVMLDKNNGFNKRFYGGSFTGLHDAKPFGLRYSMNVAPSLFDLIKFDEANNVKDVRKGFFISPKYYHSEFASLKGKAHPKAMYVRRGRQLGYICYGKFPRKDVKLGGKEKKDVGSLAFGDYNYIRGSEMYLTIAECQARQGGKDGDAQENLHKVRSRSIPTATKSTKTGTDLIDEILLERRKELFGEGHEYRDILRLGKGLNRDKSHGTGQLTLPAGDPRFQWPIPEKASIVNPNLLK